MPALGWIARELLHVHIQTISSDIARKIDSRGATVNTFCKRTVGAANAG